MSIFNPEVAEGRDRMPSYLRGYSEPISMPHLVGDAVDKSSGLAIAGAAVGLEGLSGLVETTAKDIINKDVRSTVEPIREDFTKELEIARSVQKNSVVPNAVATPSGPMVIGPEAEPTTPVPTAIENGLGKAAALQDALKNGKINDTYYDLRLKTAVTDLRSKYPGFVDYIDSRVSAITGINPANAYVQNLMQDINAARAVKDKEFDHTESSLRKMNDDGAPNANIFLKAFRDKRITQDQAEEYINGTNKTLYNIRLQDAKRNSAKGDREAITLQREADFTTEVGSTMSSNMSAMVTIPGVDTPQGITEAIKAMAAHPEQYTSSQMRALATQLEAQKQVVLQQFRARSNESAKDADGKTYSYVSDIGVTKRDAILKSQVIEQYDGLKDALIGGGPEGAGLAYLRANQIVARNSDVADKISLGPVGKDIATYKYLSDQMGPAFAGVLAPLLIHADVATKLRPLFNESATQARAQPDFTETGRPITLKDHTDVVDKLQAEGKITAAMKSRYIGSLVNIVDDLKNPKMPDTIKENVVRYLFSPEGQGILSKIKTDYTDPDTGKFIPGKYSVFQRLTSDDVVKEVGRLSASKPELGQMYKNYLEREAGAQLFYKEFQNLNYFTGHDNLHFKYNDGAKGGTPYVELIDKDGKSLSNINDPSLGGGRNIAKPAIEDRQYLTDINRMVGRINDGLAGMSRVEKGLGGDVNSYILNFMQRSQVNLGKNWQGLPQKLMDAIAASRAPQRKIEDTFKELKN